MQGKPAKFDKGRKLSKVEYEAALKFAVFKDRCQNGSLLKRLKREAKKKFNVYPSAYANAWIKKEYKKRGGMFKGENPKIRNYKNKKQTNIVVNDKGKITEMTQTTGS